MRNTIFLLFFLYSSAVYAQYCCTEQGTVAYYVTENFKKKKTLRDSVIVKNVLDEPERIVVEQLGYGDSYTPADVREGTNREIFIYGKKTGFTEFVILDAETENEEVRRYMASGYVPGREAEAEEEYRKYSEHFRAEGGIRIPIKENAAMDEKLPECHYLHKMSFMKMRAHLKGCYKGKEMVNTPAGDFECVKIQTESEGNVMLFSEKEYATYWYAKGVGLVKSEIYTKRGKLFGKASVARCPKTVEKRPARVPVGYRYTFPSYSFMPFSEISSSLSPT